MQQSNRPTRFLTKIFLVALLAAAGMTTATIDTRAQIPRIISYQGLLVDNGGAPLPDGIVTLRLALYDAVQGGTIVHEQTEEIAISGGLFATEIGPIAAEVPFDRPLWLAISVDGGADLEPRTPLTASPYALSAETSMRAVAATTALGLSPEATGVVRSINGLEGSVRIRGLDGTTVRTEGSEILIGAVGGEGQDGAWLLGGNGGIDPEQQQLGTLDDIPLQLMARGRTSLEIVPSIQGTPNLIAGTRHVVADSIFGSSIISGAFDTLRSHSSILGGFYNRIGTGSEYSVVPGGRSNRIGDRSVRGTISGGTDNEIGTESTNATIGGGYINEIGDNAGSAVIAGGFDNDVDSGSSYGSILGGLNNKIFRRSNSSSIGGGVGNEIGPLAPGSAIGGGRTNVIGEDVEESVIAGGSSNRITGPFVRISTILGGGSNSIGASAGVIGGGIENTIDSGAYLGFIGGGSSNSIGMNAVENAIVGGSENSIGENVRQSAILGGEGNTITDGMIGSAIVGGYDHRVSGFRSTVLGGRGLSLEGNGSVGFLAQNRFGAGQGNNAMTIEESHLLVAGNADIWLANNTGEASRLVFFTPTDESESGSFPSGDIEETAIRAPDAQVDSKGFATDVEYILPPSIPIAPGDNPGNLVLGISNISRPANGKLVVELEWRLEQ